MSEKNPLQADHSSSEKTPAELSKGNNASNAKAELTGIQKEDPPTSSNLDDLIKTALKELNAQRTQLNNEIDQLSIRKKDLEKELLNSFEGQSNSIARRVKGFQDYLTGALQDLAQSAEQLELVVQPVVVQPSPLDKKDTQKIEEAPQQAVAVADNFRPDEEIIRECLDQFLGQPDFYAEPWKLRRSLEKKDVALLEDWFFNMGGRGAQPSRGSRARNVLASKK